MRCSSAEYFETAIRWLGSQPGYAFLSTLDGLLIKNNIGFRRLGPGEVFRQAHTAPLQRLPAGRLAVQA